MESRFGRDFSGVRIHTDSRAQQAAGDIRAQAFTTGRNIYFRAGAYQPGTPRGDRLLSRELTHTVQQGAAGRPLGSRPAPQVRRSVSPRVQRGVLDWGGDKLSGAASAVQSGVNAVGRGVRAVGSAVAEMASAAKDALLGKIAGFARDIPGFARDIPGFARDIPGYHLIGVILGRDPITSQTVERSPMNLVRGLMGLVPGGEAKYQQLQESGALQRAFD